MAGMQIRLDIRYNGRTDTYIWVLQKTAPVTDVCQSPEGKAFESRVAAVKDFQQFCIDIGWNNDIVQVPIP